METIDTQSFDVTEDQSLVQAHLNGDGSAFTKLVDKYRRQVYAVAYRYTRNAAEADDLTQDTFIKAYENLHRFRGEASFKTWLLRITSNSGINILKSGRISKDSGAAPEDHHQEVDTPGVLEDLITVERKDKLRRAIATLPPKQQQTLMLKTYEDMTCSEVAAIMKCSVGTVKANIFNAMKKLKAQLEVGG